MTEKFEELIENARRHVRTADHIAYVTFPLVKEKRLLLKILDDMYLVMVNIINAILQYDYVYKRISLYKSPLDNFSTFKQRCAKRFGITDEEINSIIEVFKIVNQHKNSPFEFMRRDKVVIMTDSLHTETISIEKIKQHLAYTKSMLSKAEFGIKSRI